MALATIFVAAAASQAIGGVSIEFYADRLRRAVAGATVRNRAEAAGHRSVADRTGRAFLVIFASVAHLRWTAGGEEQYGQAKKEDLDRKITLSHSVRVSAKKSAYKPPRFGGPQPMASTPWLYRRARIMTR